MGRAAVARARRPAPPAPPREDPGDRAIRFINLLTHTKGEWAGQSFHLRPWQEEIIRPLFGTVLPDGRRQYRTCYVEIPRKCGKALALDTPLPTPSGWTTMGEVKEGEIVFDERGEQVRVIGTSDVMYGHDCYRLEFSDGTAIVADAKHEWYTRSRRTGRRPQTITANGITRTVTEWSVLTGIGIGTLWARIHNLGWRAEDAISISIEEGKVLRRRWRHEYERGKPMRGGRGRRVASDDIWTTEQIRDALHVTEIERNHSIPVCGAIQTPDIDLPIDPYILGAWLGNGSSDGAVLSCGDQDVEHFIRELRAAGYVVRSRRELTAWRLSFQAQESGCPVAARSDANLRKRLRWLGILGSKAVPAIYLRSSPRQRLALLQGMMDTDGTCSARGQCEFTTTKQTLRDGALEIIRSLGLKVTCREGRAMLRGKDCGVVWDICFFPVASTPAFRLKRKLARQTAVGGRPNRQITAVTPVPSVPVRCIAVDSPSHLYLAGDGMIPTHNTEIAAAIALLMLLGDGEAGAEVYSAAVDLEQASLAFNVAAQMVRNDPRLSARLEIIPSRRRIVDHETGSFYRAIPADAPSAHGYNASAVIYDELHAAPNRELWDVLTTSMGSRRQPLTFVITTAGYDRKSICWELHDYAVKVRDGVLTDPTFLPVLYGAPDDADWLDEAVWRAANPALGDFRSLEEMRMMAQQAKEVPARQNTFRRLYLCQWTESETRWFDPAVWTDGAGDPVMLEDLRGRACFVGLDLSSTTDLTAAVLVALGEDGGVTAVPTFWVPAEKIRGRAQRDRVPYPEWARAGHLQATEGNVVDYDAILAWVLSLPEHYGIEVLGVGFDPWNATGLVTKLQEAGVPCEPVRQGFQSLSGPSKHLEALVVSRKLRHGGHPVLAWCASNVVAEQDPSGNIKPSKRKSTERIDGIVALVTALAVALATPVPQPSIYETRGLLVV